MAWLEPASAPDVDAFLARVLRLDPDAVVRLRPADHRTVALWSRLPFEVLVSRGVRGSVPGDVTVGAQELSAALDGPLPPSRDADWRWSLPPQPGRVVERVPVAEMLRLDAAAAATVRTASVEGVGGRAVGSRVLRDALLDHVPIVVTTATGERFDVPQRLIQAVVRMGFLGRTGLACDGAVSNFVDVRVAGSWVGLACAYGVAWYRGRPPLLLI